jgi:Na+/H+ antiporter NhaD/arsenite permease-like protein
VRVQVPRALSRIDTEGIIFFLGVLLSIAALDNAGILKDLAQLLDNNIPSKELIATVIGLASAVVDNVPLVAATMGMYDLSVVPQDSMLWQLIAYCAGTGGSILIIGSAAGVAFMGMESAEFMWYVKRVSPWALIGYLAGIGAYIGQNSLVESLNGAPQVLAILPDAVSTVSM